MPCTRHGQKKAMTEVLTLTTKQRLGMLSITVLLLATPSVQFYLHVWFMKKNLVHKANNNITHMKSRP